MSDVGLLTLQFEPGFQKVTGDLSKARKEENLISLKLIPNENSIGWLDEKNFHFR